MRDKLTQLWTAATLKNHRKFAGGTLKKDD
jgi:hypothetical protein